MSFTVRYQLSSCASRDWEPTQPSLAFENGALIVAEGGKEEDHEASLHIVVIRTSDRAFTRLLHHACPS